MIDVLEIPLITHDQDTAIDFVNLLSVQSESIYNGFRFYTYPVSPSQKIFFYLLEPYEEMENAHIWERIIPKAPFSLMFFSWDEKVKNTPLEQLYNQYISHFSTPIVFLTGNSSEELDFSSINDEILQSHLENILLYDAENAESVKSTLLNAMLMMRDTVDQELDDR